MRRRHALAVLAFAPLLTLFGACRTPTQATLVVTTSAKCEEVRGGVAITVARGSREAEYNVGEGYVSATTQSCDPSQTPASFGTLVVTPSDDGDRASVVVIAAVEGQDPALCKPNNYAKCIVSRRSFAFIDNVALVIPVLLDPLCVGVACDAFSTCLKGECYKSDMDCDPDGNCRLAAELPGGGLDPAAVVDAGGPRPDGSSGTDASQPDGSQPDGASNDGSSNDGSSNDGTADAPDDGLVVTDGPPPPDGDIVDAISPDGKLPPVVDF